MLQKHRQVLILLVGLLYIYSVCPFLCAAFEQKFCDEGPQDVSSAETETRVTCCQNTKTDTANGTETPSESGKSCCSTDLELVLPDDRHNTHEFRQSIDPSLVSILPISTTFPVTSWESSQILAVPLTAALFPDDSLTRRGPPFTQC